MDSSLVKEEHTFTQTLRVGDYREPWTSFERSQSLDVNCKGSTDFSRSACLDIASGNTSWEENPSLSKTQLNLDFNFSSSLSHMDARGSSPFRVKEKVELVRKEVDSGGGLGFDDLFIKGKIQRSRNGCWTCRLRRKRCTQEKPHCFECFRLNLKCDGYSETKPDFMTNKSIAKRKMSKIKKITTKKPKSKHYCLGPY